jgi:PQQ-like domain
MDLKKGFFIWAIFAVSACFALRTQAGQPTQSNDCPCWRGPNADGMADSRSLPIRWDTKENIRWSVQLPGWGTSSPVVYANRVFITSEVEDGDKKSLLTLCYDRSDGRELWRLNTVREFGYPRVQTELELFRVHARAGRGKQGAGPGQLLGPVVESRSIQELIRK